MGRAKGSKRNQHRHRLNPLQKTATNSQEIVLEGKETAIPVLEKLSSSEAKERSWSASAISNLILGDSETRLLLLKNGLVKKLLERLTDDSIEVVIEVTGAIRNLAVEDGYDVCMDMYRKNILSPLKTWMAKIASHLEGMTNGKTPEGQEEAAYQSCLFAVTENICAVLLNLGETTTEVMTALNNNGVLPFLFQLAVHGSLIPEQVQEIVLQALCTLLDDNLAGIKEFVSSSNVDIANVLSVIGEYISKDLPTLQAYSIGVLFQFYEAKQLDKKLESQLQVVPALDNLPTVALPKLGQLLQDGKQFLRSLTTKAFENEKTLADYRIALTVPVVLEILASIASLLQSLADGQVSDEDEMDPEVAATEAIEELDNLVGDDEAADDVDMDSEVPAKQSVQVASEPIVFMLQNIMPILLDLLEPFEPAVASVIPDREKGFLDVVHERSLECLNNIAWSCNGIISEDSPSIGQWRSQAQIILAWVSKIVGPQFEASPSSFLTLCSVLLAASKVYSGNAIPFTPDQVDVLIQFAARLNDFQAQSRLVGALGALAKFEGDIAFNSKIGDLLMSCLTNDNPQPDVAVEALYAIFDVYGDKVYAYDTPVFVQKNYLAALQQAVPALTKMTKRIDRKRCYNARMRAEEAMQNLHAFIDYKINEYK
ncbi:hypothetical protein SJAG_01621 [Schizosaccharomyces japonicus yFS275]|uniref:SYO1-like TPR repeats domain-containing protein n=1 Tax=Schizosaccharomyces japonicus (strain yFS275 / FY16936) TaxID=402676 RepID=B6JYF9_SCHJY|nr:hypothetical protein SJAG_01621 [Schizosaccharomyces japonicus yFS275]EEB06577.1 hypothetical protein SJAG_01621 [Schizosaccharomyces japonicus yFS275]